jgi:hypothetical protein
MQTKFYNTSILNLVISYLRSNHVTEVILKKSLILVQEAIMSHCCSTSDVQTLFTPQDGPFVQMIRTIVYSNRGRLNLKALLQIALILQQEIYGCCDTLSFTTNHVPVDNIALQGYPSIQSGGSQTNIQALIIGYCAPYTVNLAFDFGSGYVVTENFSTSEDAVTMFNNLTTYLIGKQVNIGDGIVTVVANNVTPGAGQIQANQLNGLQGTARLIVTDCKSIVTTATVDFEIEMKRVTKMLTYSEEKKAEACDCAQIVSDLDNGRYGGGALNNTNSRTIALVLNLTMDGINVFKTPTATPTHLLKDTLNVSGGINPQLNFRNPVVIIIDTVALTGSPADVGCIYTQLDVYIDVRSNDTNVFVNHSFFSTVPCQPIYAGQQFQFNTDSIEYSFPITIGQILVDPFALNYQVVNITTPSQLGW